jgi:hypothetical protein
MKNHTATRIEGEYGITVIAPDGGSRPEPTPAERERERQADRITYKEMRSLFQCDHATFAAIVERADFPRAISFKMSGWVNPQREPIFSRRSVNKFIADYRQLVNCLPEQV